MAAAIVIAILLTLGAIAAWIYRDRAMKAPLPIVTFALVLSLGYGYIAHERDLTIERTHDQCIDRVARSIGNRSMWLDLANVVEQGGNADGAEVIRTLLDKNLPALSIDDC
ncbi:MAG TPA: hypothetical protein VFZ00_02840 [Solirubrobacter sp.]|nr:hypothetical protein [Solirubrobacter sp.]